MLALLNPRSGQRAISAASKTFRSIILSTIELTRKASEMIRQTALFLILIFVSGSAIAQSSPPNQPEVLVLGTFHFTGGGMDTINSEVDDFFSPERQIEISEVLDRLEQYAPTKILVEFTPDRESTFNALYQSYLTGEHELSVLHKRPIDPNC
jgi:hypothetical protein